ncbi:hypothetical protein KSF_084080 [Reticulibacter mediterranei]|uniref:Uncharacterized protein n=1 Tax=Reticulibacter mediterranei TaxID=2778369 RepID=A0A8J3ITP7_9CHLR|nr:hypothetical protein [Reticulibacter mediterranei]GHO98360.1 hypothetical protein KSF_084080 [Reticulibacter mediterranei]
MTHLLAGLEAADILHDLTWLAWIGIVVSVVVPLWVHYQEKQTKKIAYELVSDLDFMDIEYETKTKRGLSVLGGTWWRNVVIRIWNAGNVAVTPDDYARPIRFAFEQETVVKAQIVERLPTNIYTDEITSTSTPSSVTIDGFVLNPKEAITITILLAGDKSGDIGLTANALIVDGDFVKRSYKKPLKKTPQWWKNSMIALGLCLFVVLVCGGWELVPILTLVTLGFLVIGYHLITPGEDDYPLLKDTNETAEAMKASYAK